MVLQSPLYNAVLVPAARRTMVRTAEANGVPWVKSKQWIEQQGTAGEGLLTVWLSLSSPGQCGSGDGLDGFGDSIGPFGGPCCPYLSSSVVMRTGAVCRGSCRFCPST
eukprot:4099224-Pleurochrysis_carterae.AAC.1